MMEKPDEQVIDARTQYGCDVQKLVNTEMDQYCKGMFDKMKLMHGHQQEEEEKS